MNNRLAVASLSTLCLLAVSSYATAANFSFFRILKQGMSGDDVRSLQIILNTSPETQISTSGSGSPGQETGYFGQMTKNAVIRYQEKNAADILVPNGLQRGTGVVGPSTITFLNKKNRTVAVSAPVSTAPISTTASAPSGTNPNNLIDLDKFIASVDSLGKSQGMSESDLGSIKQQIIKDVATTTDLRKEFVEIAKKYSMTSRVWEPSLGDADIDIGGFLSGLFTPKRAEAAGAVPFGGKLFFSFFCTCSGNWLLTIQPLPPSYVTLLTYTPGTQRYLNFNIPFTLNMLGFYNPGGGQCQIYVGMSCATIPSYGAVSSTVGSS